MAWPSSAEINERVNVLNDVLNIYPSFQKCRQFYRAEFSFDVSVVGAIQSQPTAFSETFHAILTGFVSRPSFQSVIPKELYKWKAGESAEKHSEEKKLFFFFRR